MIANNSLIAPHSPNQLVALCIDDSPFDLKLNDRILKRSCAFQQVLQCPSALEALDLLRGGLRPDVIFLDVNMPLMNGFEFLEAATAEFGSTFDGRVVVMLTSSLNPRDRARAESFAAVHAFLSKPVGVEDAMNIAESLGELSARMCS